MSKKFSDGVTPSSVSNDAFGNNSTNGDNDTKHNCCLRKGTGEIRPGLHCNRCLGTGQVPSQSQSGAKQTFRVVNDAELESEYYRLDGINDIRETFLSYPYRVCTELFTDLYRDLDGDFVDETGNVIFLDLEPFWDNTPDKWWLDAILTPTPRKHAIYLRRENRERLRIILSLFRASFPVQAEQWGKCPNDTFGW